jgi:carbohydrate-selective porin OprB
MEQELFKDKIYMAAGKLDLSNWFDTNEVANSGDTQFLSDALVGSENIPFPRKGIGALLRFAPSDWIYFALGSATAKSTATKVGLNKAFNSAFFVNEFGLSPKFASLQGNYRFIFYLNHQKLDLINDEEEGTKNNDFGFALSFDQAISKHITLFMRYGFSDPKVREIEYFWSAGSQIIEPIAGRKFDCLGVAFAQSVMSDDYRTANEPDVGRAETMYEVYYSWRLNEAMTLTPNVQLAINPNADKTAADEVVCGLRFLFCF